MFWSHRRQGVQKVLGPHEQTVVRLHYGGMKEVLATLVLYYEGEATVAAQKRIKSVPANLVSVDVYSVPWSKLMQRLVWVCRVH